MKSSTSGAGAFLLAALISQPCFAKFLDLDLAQIRASSNTVAVVEPADLFPSVHEPARSVAAVEPPDLLPAGRPTDSSTDSSSQPALFELGVGMGGALDPDYPGSDQSRVTILPFPFAVYRGQILRSDRSGTRAKLFNGGGFDLSVSGTGALPVSAGSNDARRGMEDLGWMLQVGPKIRFAARDWSNGSTLRLGVSARAALSALHFNDLTARGYTFQPEIVYQRPNFLFERLDFFTSLSSTFATATYMDYLYGVRTAEATADRRAFAAQGGYLESELQAGVSYRTFDGRHKFVLNLQAGSLKGGVNEDSPLVRTKIDAVVGVAWVWTIFESEEKASSAD